MARRSIDFQAKTKFSGLTVGRKRAKPRLLLRKR
jgi:hypothetical protein